MRNIYKPPTLSHEKKKEKTMRGEQQASEQKGNRENQHQIEPLFPVPIINRVVEYK
jgi:hypothetical protein